MLWIFHCDHYAIMRIPRMPIEIASHHFTKLLMPVATIGCRMNADEPATLLDISNQVIHQAIVAQLQRMPLLGRKLITLPIVRHEEIAR